MHFSQRWEHKETLPLHLQNCKFTPKRSLLLETGLGLSPKDDRHARCRVQLFPAFLLILIVKNSSFLQHLDVSSTLLIVTWTDLELAFNVDGPG